MTVKPLSEDDYCTKRKIKLNAKQNVNSWKVKRGNKTLEF